MGKGSMTTLRERRAELGLVQMNLWIREANRAAVEPFKQRVGELDPAQRPGRKRLEAVKASALQIGGRRRKPRQGRSRSPQRGGLHRDRRSPCPVG